MGKFAPDSDGPIDFKAPKVKELPEGEKTNTVDVAYGSSFHLKLLNTFGTEDPDFASWAATKVTGAVKTVSVIDDNGVFAAMSGIDPQNEVESMLASQMVATHAAAMTALTRMQTCDRIDHLNYYSNQANKLMRTYASQVETLKRYRQKAQQTVRVERVYVNEGGQAIVGDVHHAEGGGQPKPEGQSHASETITYAPGETLPCQDEAENVVPITSDEERAMQNARWNQSGSSKRQ